MPFEGGDRASSSASNPAVQGGRNDENGRVVDNSGVASNVCPMPHAPRPAQTQYVLSPSPSFDPVFDDLLEGGAGSGSSALREYASTKSENMSTVESTRKIEYLNELLRDEKKLQQAPGFRHLRKLLKREIERIRDDLRLHHTPVARVENVIRPEREPRILSEGRFNLGLLQEVPVTDGPMVTVVEKVYPPIEQFPEYNFIGRLIGPRGRTVKQIEMESGCQITIRGRGSENKGKHFRKRGQLGFENENEPLHVRIAATDYKERAQFMVDRCKILIERLLVPVDDDELKQRQLHELALIRRGDRWGLQQLDSSEDTIVPDPSAFVQQPPFTLVPPPVAGPSANLFYIGGAVPEAEGNGFVPMLWPRTNY